MNSLSQNLIETAWRDYNSVCEELNRPAHDVVTHSVCHMTREAISSMLRAYLGSKNITFSETDSMNQLIKHSIAADQALDKFDFTILACSHLPLSDNPANYCLSEDRVTNCFRLLNSLKNYLLDEMKIDQE